MARTILIQILGDADQLRREFKSVGDDSEKMGKKLGGSFKKWAKLGAAGAAAGGVALVTKQLFDSVGAAKESEKAEMRLGQAFDSAKVKGRDRAKAQAAINKVSRRAALDDEELSDVLANMTRSTGSVQKGMKGMALAAEIARARNIPLKTAAKAVEKAYLGMDMGLRKVGITVTKLTPNQDKLNDKIKALKDESKKATKVRQAAIAVEIKALEAGKEMAKDMDERVTATSALQKATKQFAGSSEKYGKTAAGAQERLSVAFENLQERVGMKLLPVLAKLATWGVKFLDWSEKNWPAFKRVVIDAFQKIRPAIDAAIRYVKGIWEVWKNTVLLIKAVVNGDWSKAWQAVKRIVKDGVFEIIAAVTAMPRKVIAALGSAAWSGLKMVGTRIKNAILSGVEGLKETIANMLQWIVNRVNGVIGPIRGALGKIGVNIPKIPDVVPHQQTGERRRTVTPGRIQPGTRPSGPRDRGQGTRATASVTGAQQVTLVMDHREVGRVTLKQQQREGRGTATSRRGPHAGRGLALG